LKVNLFYVRGFEVLTHVLVRRGVFWNIMLCRFVVDVDVTRARSALTFRDPAQVQCVGRMYFLVAIINGKFERADF
jgi:hypothetical protein